MPLSGLPCSSLGAAGERSMSARQPDGKAPVTAQMPPGFVPAVRLCPLTNKKMVLPLRPWRRRCDRIAEQEFRILHLQCAAHVDRRVWPLSALSWPDMRLGGLPQPPWTDSPRPPTARLQGMPASWTISGSIIIGTSCAGGPGGIGAGMHKQGFNYICLPASIDARLHVGQVLGASYDGPSEKP